MLNIKRSSVMLDQTLDYISRVLLEEEIDELNISGHIEDITLSNMEKAFYDILGKKYQPFPNNQLVVSTKADHASSFCLLKDQASSSSTSDSLLQSLPIIEFQRGIEEGMKFLPTMDKLVSDGSVGFKLVGRENFGLKCRSKNKENSNGTYLDFLEGRNNKISMIHFDEPITSGDYNKVLLDHGIEYAKQETSNLREIMQREVKSCIPKEIQGDHTELSTLLIRCSEAVAIGDRKIAQELLNRIRFGSSPNGNGIRRLACILGDALEARLAGVGSEYYRKFDTVQVTTPFMNILKAFHLHLKAIPFAKINYYFANHSILKATKNATQVHIIDLGIQQGFQWPSLIQALAKRKGRISKLRITAVEFPDPGFRPSKRVKEVGRRLAECAQSFNVRFEYRGIAMHWESINIEDFKISDDEILIVNSIFHFKRVKDENFAIDSLRNQVLSLIRRMNPHIFIQGDSSRSFSSYFVTRFRQVLSFYTLYYEQLEKTIPRGNYKERELLENLLFVPGIVNVVACEGLHWTERPETYKQSHRRNLVAGFEQLQLDLDVVKECKNILRNVYDKRYFIEEENNWLLMGWLGRVFTAVSIWKPKLK